MGDESHFPLVSVSDVVVSPSDVKFSEDRGVFYLINEILDQWERVGIFDSMCVDISIVLARLEGIRSVFFVDKEEGGCLRGVRGSYPS